MSAPKVLFGFHAVGVRLKTAPQSILEIYVDVSRKDARMRQFLEKANEAGARLVEADGMLKPAELVEDELILALPVVPVSPDAEAVERDFAPTAEETAQASPFAALAGLKRK